MLRILILLLLAVYCLSLSAESALQDYRADYTVQINGFKVGELQRSLQRLEDGYYMLETRAHTTGLAAWFKPDTIIEQSRWRFVEGRPQPLLYRYHYTGRRADVIEEQKFSWEEGQLSSLRDGKITYLELESGVLDKQVFEIAMHQALAAGVMDGRLPVAVRGRLTEYDFSVQGQEQVVTRPFGKIDTLKIVRGKTTMWLSPRHDYLVVKIEQRDRNNTATSYLVEVTN